MPLPACVPECHSFDLDLPLRCDDEYWEPRPGHAAFRQPENKPSYVEFFICQLSLNRILSFTLKLLVRSTHYENDRFFCFLILHDRYKQYATNRSKAMLGLADDQWEQKIVAELDSALNTWFDSVPSHRECLPVERFWATHTSLVHMYTKYPSHCLSVRWDPACRNDIFFDQSAALYCTYYLAQILIHRPFIPAVRRSVLPTVSPSRPFPPLVSACGPRN